MASSTDTVVEIGLLGLAGYLLYLVLKGNTPLGSLLSGPYADSTVASGYAPAPFSLLTTDPFTGGAAYWLATELTSPITGSGSTGTGGGGAF